MPRPTCDRIYNRKTILSMLFRETDRVQRMKSSLCMCCSTSTTSPLECPAGFGGLRRSALPGGRPHHAPAAQLRPAGRAGKDEFLLALPGCSSVNAVMMAERLRADVFSTPFRVAATPFAFRPASALPTAWAARGRRAASMPSSAAIGQGHVRRLSCASATARSLCRAVSFLRHLRHELLAVGGTGRAGLERTQTDLKANAWNCARSRRTAFFCCGSSSASAGVEGRLRFLHCADGNA